MIDVVVPPVEDMTDWRNWKVGDIISVASGDGYVEPGLHAITDTESDDYRSDLPVEVKQGWPDIKNITWSSRP